MPTGRLEPLIRYVRRAAVGHAPADLDDGSLLALFTARRDEAAFAALVRRHGPMVLAACRRVLRDQHAAEDAFQATFLVLARKAGSISRPELLGPWLHGVACRTAAKARTQAARRRDREARVPVAPTVEPSEEPVWRDLRRVLDEEVNRLPARQGAAVVLCYLEGRTNAEAAQRLGCSRGTIATLLARARERLRRRLTGRGLGLPAGVAAAALAGAARAVVPAALECSTVKAAALFAAGKVQAAGLLSAPAAALAEGVVRTMFVHKLKIVAAILLVMAVAGTGGGVAAYRAAAQTPPVAATRPELAEPVAEPPPAVAPLPAASPASYQTINFLVTAPTPGVAGRVGRAAEKHRKALALLWLGRELPDWDEPCPITVRLTGRKGGWPAARGIGSATTFAFDRGKVLSQNMILEGQLEGILHSALPHEITHTILAHWFKKPVPRWADEGAAILAESPTERAKHGLQMANLVATDRLLPLRKLLASRDYPADVLAFFVQSYSLTDFLVRSGGRKKFLAFVAQGAADGWDKSAKTHYGYRRVADLERAWLASVAKERRQPPKAETVPPPPVKPVGRALPVPPPRVSATKSPRGQLPPGPAPVQVLAALSDEGRLIVWRVVGPVSSYIPQTVRNERGQLVTTYKQVTSSHVREENYDVARVRAFDTKGETISRKQLRRMLKDETPALISTDGRPVDPLHLRLVKEGTLILVLPLPTPPRAPDAPPVPLVVPTDRGGAPLPGR